VDLSLTIDSKNHSVVRYVLELCHFVMDDNERQAFKLQSYDSKEAMGDAAANIQRRAFRKMWELEGLNADVEEQLNKKMGSRGKKPTVAGVGARVRTYMEQFKLKELQNRPATDTDAVGTPPDNRSI